MAGQPLFMETWGGSGWGAPIVILVTAFKPFGFIRGWLMKKNSSLEVLEALQAENPGNHHFLVLDVSDQGIETLKKTVRQLKPSGILSMGEYALLSGERVILEPFAVNCRPSIMPDIFGDPKVESPFARGHGAGPEDSVIGRYYCNAAYLAGLEWASQSRGQPVAFVHVPILGDRSKHVEQVRKILAQM